MHVCVCVCVCARWHVFVLLGVCMHHTSHALTMSSITIGVALAIGRDKFCTTQAQIIPVHGGELWL